MTNNIINNNVVGQNQACAVCKHQRKKCSEKCALAPFFPSEKSQEFQSVHKIFGVSKVLKMVQQVEEKAKAVESLVWEAQWRERDPTFGCFGEFQRTVNENRELRSKLSMLLGPGAGLHGWNSNNSNAVNGYNANSNNANSIIIDYGLDNGNIYFDDIVPSSAISYPLAAAAYPHGGRTGHGLHSSMVNYNYSSQHGYLPGQQQESRDMKAMNDGANGYTPSRGG
ncbi:hypothetical protein Scep_011481 [Stephania cephalantha]|uniref:LOB domain-containing protein n=1 Tax=Stephania cephalantha TaxID=152367 RepID=A0AAP0JDG1_9MAGN